jgi:hypothetical protein
MAKSVVAILNQAVNLARSRGIECAGWMMQATDGGYVAWLFREDDEGQWPLWDDVDVKEEGLAAAEWCLARLDETDDEEEEVDDEGQ